MSDPLKKPEALRPLLNLHDSAPQAHRLLQLDAHGEPAVVCTGEALETAIRDLAAGLAARGWRGERMVLAITSEQAFMVAFLACLRAGAVAVPAVAPGTVRNNRRLHHIITDSGAVAVLVDDAALRQLRLRGADAAALAGCPVLELGELAGEREPVAGESAQTESLPPDMPAYLQYTSGSTRAPRGVVITRAQLAAQLAMLARCVALAPGEAVVNPMPLNHDFGLIMSLHALTSGGRLVLLPAQYAIRDPGLWLTSIDAYNAVLTASAPFLLDLCTRRVDEAHRAALDMSSLRKLLVGAEPIPASCLRAFMERFAACGFAPKAMRPGYGLAEATLILSLTDDSGPVIRGFDARSLRAGWAAPDPDGDELVGCGRACFTDSLRIVAPERRSVCAEREVGELWVRAPCVAEGYWQKPEASASTLRNELPGEPGRWLRTGDLAFIDRGELFVMGRMTDTLIIRGENRYPQDIEWAVAGCHPALNPGGVMAFPVAAGGLEALALACEIRRAARRTLNADDVFRAVRQALVEQQGLAAERIVLVPEAALPRTSSGKAARRRCRADYEAGELKMLAEWQAPQGEPGPAVDDDGSLLGLCRRMLRAPRLQADDPLLEHGLDSLRAAELVLEIEERWGSAPELVEFDDDVSVARLQAWLEGDESGLAETDEEMPGSANSAANIAALDYSAFDPARLRRLRSYTASWRGEWASPRHLLFGVHLGGSLPPLAWCFQGRHEFETLARWLGPDQPLIGMRSGHYVIDYADRDAIDALAAIYIDELSDWPGAVPRRFGGNCQGSVVALAMARRIIADGGAVDGLFLLENITARVDPRPVPVPAAMLFGEHSREFNPYLLFPEPEPGWRKLYRAGWSVDIIGADHGGYFRAPGIEELTRALVPRLADPPAGARTPSPGRPLADDEARASIALKTALPERVAPGATLEVTVAVTNGGPRAWTPEDGIALANHWLSADLAVVRWLDGHRMLDSALAPGKTREAMLEIRAPEDTGEYVVEFDLAEQGVAWFGERGGTALQVGLQVEQ